ncbi:hypothetical protein [Cylindrospermopsis curvispora]|uniref:Uncharacterized protein n=1 Tax=Cylindrospermopsis curvispora GIHE-G1 TaxID=2666332 RepID=A0A7H0F135_9CYAN|nr:hypothetical protein [Cylindrospermopsis curvispora]QNP29751.1 hypothetical protein IAR63_01000 [Cylindrospermopsis curvispora GIHE-G1]
MTVEGSTNTEVFLNYVNQVLLPQLWKGAIVVLDVGKINRLTRKSPKGTEATWL